MSTTTVNATAPLFYARRSLASPATPPPQAPSDSATVTGSGSPASTTSAKTITDPAPTHSPAFYSRAALNGGAVQQLATAAATAAPVSSTVTANGVTAASATAAYQTAAQAGGVPPAEAVQAASNTTSSATIAPVTQTPTTTGTAATTPTDTAQQQAMAIASQLPVNKTADGGYKAVQVSDADAATLKAGAVFSTVAGDISTHAATGSVFGLSQSDAKPLSTQTFNFAFANGGRDVNNFALDLSGTGLDADTLESNLKSGALQISFQKWNGVGQVGDNAASLSLSGDRYSPTSFMGGEASGTSLNARTNMSGDGTMINGTFGGFSAKDGLTMTISSFSPSINVTGAALTTY